MMIETEKDAILKRIKELEILLDLDYALPSSGIEETEGGYLIPEGTKKKFHTAEEAHALLLELKLKM